MDTIKKYRAEVFRATEKYALGESPFYNPDQQKFSWVDIIKGRFYTLKGNEKTCFDFGKPLGAAVPVKGRDAYVLAAMDGLYVYENGRAELLYDLTKTFKPYIRCNDAKADSRGRIYFGSSVADDVHEAEGDLYCYDNGNVRIVQPNTLIANGMAWNADQKHFYFSDSLEHAVFEYDYEEETGNILNRRVLFTVENGVPDGMCIDKNDNLWVAVWGGRRIEKRSSASGELLALIDVPAQNVTSCCFKEDGKTLFITTSGEGQSGEFDGCLFLCDTKGQT